MLQIEIGHVFKCRRLWIEPSIVYKVSKLSAFRSTMTTYVKIWSMPITLTHFTCNKCDMLSQEELVHLLHECSIPLNSNGTCLLCLIFNLLTSLNERPNTNKGEWELLLHNYSSTNKTYIKARTCKQKAVLLQYSKITILCSSTWTS